MSITIIKPEFWADVEVNPENRKSWDDACPMGYGIEYLYRAYGKHGHLLYVGVTGSPCNRLTEHRRRAAWWPSVRLLEFWRVQGAGRDEAQVSVRRWESQCIAQQQPIWNVQRRPDWSAHAHS